MVLANDGGGAVSVTGGVAAQGAPAWSAQDFPTAQYYHVITTKHLPYHVCGAQQDGSTVCVSSEPAPAAGAGGRRRWRRRRWTRWRRRTGRRYGPGGGEPGYIAPDPKDPDVFFAGHNNGQFLVYTNRRTGQTPRSASVSAHVLGRAGERDSRTRAVDVSDRLLARRSEHSVHRHAARLEDDEHRTGLGRRSAAT